MCAHTRVHLHKIVASRWGEWQRDRAESAELNGMFTSGSLPSATRCKKQCHSCVGGLSIPRPSDELFWGCSNCYIWQRQQYTFFKELLMLVIAQWHVQCFFLYIHHIDDFQNIKSFYAYTHAILFVPHQMDHGITSNLIIVSTHWRYIWSSREILYSHCNCASTPHWTRFPFLVLAPPCLLPLQTTRRSFTYIWR